MTLIEILIVVALIGLILGVLIPNLTDGLHKSIQKRTLADMHAVAIAMISYHTDMHGAAAAGAHIGAISLEDFEAIDWADVTDLLVPAYIDHLPQTDPWGNFYDYYYGRTTEDFNFELTFGIRSRGRDGIADDVAYIWGAFDPVNYTWDIVWLDGLFVTWPAHQGEETGGGGCNQGLGDGIEECDPGNSTNPNSPSNDEPGGGPGSPGKTGGGG